MLLYDRWCFIDDRHVIKSRSVYFAGHKIKVKYIKLLGQKKIQTEITVSGFFDGTKLEMNVMKIRALTSIEGKTVYWNRSLWSNYIRDQARHLAGLTCLMGWIPISHYEVGFGFDWFDIFPEPIKFRVTSRSKHKTYGFKPVLKIFSLP